MNSTEHDIWTALKGISVIALLRLAWEGIKKLADWLPGYFRQQKQTEIDTRRVANEEIKVEREAQSGEAERILKMQANLDEGFKSMIGSLSSRIDEQERKISASEAKIGVLEKRLSEEEEARKMAWITAEVAHVRADEMEKQRARALSEVAELRQQNNNLRAMLADADKARAVDRATIETLTRRIEENNEHIARMEGKLQSFEHGTFELTRVHKGE